MQSRGQLHRLIVMDEISERYHPNWPQSSKWTCSISITVILLQISCSRILWNLVCNFVGKATWRGSRVFFSLKHHIVLCIICWQNGWWMGLKQWEKWLCLIKPFTYNMTRKISATLFPFFMGLLLSLEIQLRFYLEETLQTKICGSAGWESSLPLSSFEGSSAPH